MYSIIIKNIQKTAQTILPLFFLFIIFSLFTVTTNAQDTQAASVQEETPAPIQSGPAAAMMMPADVSPTPVSYQLPYPGILPGAPLYFLKVARDRIVWFLISDPLKKGEFDLLQADKRLAAGYILFQQNPKQEKDIVSVISKGDNYFFEGLNQIALATKQGKDSGALLNTMLTSSQKHQEILQIMEKTASPSLRAGLQTEEKRVDTLQTEVEQSINKK